VARPYDRGTDRRRAVSPVLATVLLVVITVVLAAVLYLLLASVAPTSVATPLSAAFAWGPDRPSGTTSSHTYNFSVAAANDGIVLSNLEIRFVAANGSVLNSTGFALTVSDPVHGAVGAYSFATASWTHGGSTLVSTTQTFEFATGAHSVSGDRLDAVGVNGFQGVVSTTVV
jgi:flagellin-like protein